MPMIQIKINVFQWHRGGELFTCPYPLEGVGELFIMPISRLEEGGELFKCPYPLEGVGGGGGGELFTCPYPLEEGGELFTCPYPLEGKLGENYFSFQPVLHN